jgi:hypothetical protein
VVRGTTPVRKHRRQLGITGRADTRAPIAVPYLWEDDEVDGGAVETLPHAEEADHVRTQYHHPGAALVH